MYDPSNVAFDRMVVLKFLESINRDSLGFDPYDQRVIEVEKPKLLRAFHENAIQFFERGELPPLPERFAQHRREILGDNQEPLQEFLETYFQPQCGHFVSTESLRRSFVIWNETGDLPTPLVDHHRVLDRTKEKPNIFGKKLARILQGSLNRWDARRAVSNQVRGWSGIEPRIEMPVGGAGDNND